MPYKKLENDDEIFSWIKKKKGKDEKIREFVGRHLLAGHEHEIYGRGMFKDDAFGKNVEKILTDVFEVHEDFNKVPFKKFKDTVRKNFTEYTINKMCKDGEIDEFCNLSEKEIESVEKKVMNEILNSHDFLAILSDEISYPPKWTFDDLLKDEETYNRIRKMEREEHLKRLKGN